MAVEAARPAPSAWSRKVWRKWPPSGWGARSSSRMMSAAVSCAVPTCAAPATSKPVLARAHFGEHPRGGFAGEADRGGDLRIVGAQEHVGPLLLAHEAGEGRRSRRDLPPCLGGARLQRGIAGLDG